MPPPRFFETGMGQKFYQRDVPALIKAIEKLAAAMEQTNEQRRIITDAIISPKGEKQEGAHITWDAEGNRIVTPKGE